MRTERQKQAIFKWTDTGCRGVIVAPPGFGKTNMGLLAIENSGGDVLIVTPSVAIVNQWKAATATLGNVTCVTIAGLHNVVGNNYDLIILDEVHKAASPQALRCLQQIYTKRLLGLTATWHRNDGAERFLGLDVVDTITTDECLKNGWTNQVIQIRVPVSLTPEERGEYDSVSEGVTKAMEKFDFKLKLLMDACKADDKTLTAMARDLGYSTMAVSVRQLKIAAFNGSRCIRKRKDIIAKSVGKAGAMATIVSNVDNVKGIAIYSFLNQVDRFPYYKLSNNHDDKDAFIECEHGWLAAVNRVNEGFNCPEVNVVLIGGNNSSKSVFTQRTGRATRFVEGKQAFVITVYCEDTVEEKWVAKASSDNDEVVYMSPEEVITLLKQI